MAGCLFAFQNFIFAVGAATLNLKGSIVLNRKNSTKISTGHFDHQYNSKARANLCYCFDFLIKLSTKLLSLKIKVKVRVYPKSIYSYQFI